MAQQAAETSAASGERAERVFNASVAKIAKELSVKLLDECQQWLVLKQTQHNRRDARRLAVGVAAAALAVFVGGYAMAGWRQDKETKAEQAVVAAVERCWKKPVTLRGGAVEMCRLRTSAKQAVDRTGTPERPRVRTRNRAVGSGVRVASRLGQSRWRGQAGRSRRTQAEQAVVEAVERCWKKPFTCMTATAVRSRCAAFRISCQSKAVDRTRGSTRKRPRVPTRNKRPLTIQARKA